MILLVLRKGKRTCGTSGKFCGRQPREKQRDGADIFLEGSAMTRAEFILFTPHDDGIKQCEVDTEDGQ
jgi:hypothetical protein